MKFKTDKVTIFSFLLSIIAYKSAGFLLIKESRISESIAGLRLEQLPEPIIFYGIGLVLLFILVSAFINDYRVKYISGVLSGMLIVFITALAGVSATRIIDGSLSIKILDTGDYPYFRVALDSGFWLLLLGLFINIINTMKYLKNRLVMKTLLVVLVIGGIATVFIFGTVDDLSIMKEFHNKKYIFLNEFLTHITISLISIGISTIIGLSLGIAVYKIEAVKKIIFPVLNISQTIPGIALFGIMVAFLPIIGLPGIGWLPAVISLVIYALLPITRNTYTAFASVNTDIIEAGKGMGMSDFQLMYKILFPLSIPVILSGIRIALVQIIGLTAIVTLIGAGGLGKFVFSGADSTAYDLILLGAIPIIVIAILFDFLMQFLIQITSPKGYKND